MRREHESIVADVLDALARYSDENRGSFHITTLAAKANLPHDRLRTYLDELSSMGLLSLGPVTALTDKGRQFLECYHAWVRIQKMYGLLPRGAAPERTSLEVQHSPVRFKPLELINEPGQTEQAQGAPPRDAPGAASSAFA